MDHRPSAHVAVPGALRRRHERAHQGMAEQSGLPAAPRRRGVFQGTLTLDFSAECRASRLMKPGLPTYSERQRVTSPRIPTRTDGCSSRLPAELRTFLEPTKRATIGTQKISPTALKSGCAFAAAKSSTAG